MLSSCFLLYISSERFPTGFRARILQSASIISLAYFIFVPLRSLKKRQTDRYVASRLRMHGTLPLFPPYTFVMLGRSVNIGVYILCSILSSTLQSVVENNVFALISYEMDMIYWNLCGFSSVPPQEFKVTDPEVRVRFPALPHFLRSSGSGTRSNQPREYTWPRDTLYPQKLPLTSPTSGGHSVGTVRWRTQVTEFSF
jgi:hypothetical protein